MNGQPFRRAEGGQINRNQPLTFRFNGRQYQGYAGDTLASALLANGVHLVARSFKYHRPRGIFTSGVEEPNALVRIGSGARAEPNIRATELPLFEGLEAASQNCWPTVHFDLGAVNNIFSRFLPAGFYYKTFKGPQTLWPWYERLIRRAAGMGTAPTQPDADTYHALHAHCDVCVVGGGPAGLMAALVAGRAGARVIIADEGAQFGGAMLGDGTQLDAAPASHWVDNIVSELKQLPEVRVWPRTTAFGYYDHNELGLIQHLRDAAGDGPRACSWRIRARQVILATGAIERPLGFAGNDRPGVMLASAARTYAHRYAVQAGGRAVIFTNNDGGYAVALDLARAGITLAAIIDSRPGPADVWLAAAQQAGVRCLTDHAVIRAAGRRHLTGVTVAPVDAQGRFGAAGETIACDLLGVSGGWNPTVHLFSQAQGTLDFDERYQAFVPGRPAQATLCAGAINACFELTDCLRQGIEAGTRAARQTGGKPAVPDLPQVNHAMPSAVPQPLDPISRVNGQAGKHFVDLQNDVTISDLQLALREGYRSVEHVKRYTTLGMGTDQGKTSNINGIAALAQLQGLPMPQVGTTTFRPPYTPVTLGAIAGQETGVRFRPLRRTPMDRLHEQAGAVFGNSGSWRRPRYYPQAGESEHEAIQREARAVRSAVGIVDVSTLGRIEVCGPDAGAFLNHVYINRMDRVRVGRCRYGVMLRDDGFVYDDGTVTRMAEDRFHITTTTAHASHVFAHLERCQQQYWPELEVYLTSAADQWAAVALAGPHARDVLQALSGAEDVSHEAFPFVHWKAFDVAGIPAQVFRVSYSGELAYEILVPSGDGERLWQGLLDAGQHWGIVAYGTEAMDVLRIEKGHCTVGAEIDGRTTPDDLGLGRMARKSSDFIGHVGLQRPALDATQSRLQLVGIQAGAPISRGAHLVVDPQAQIPVATDGHVTSSCYSPTLETHVALALVRNGRQRQGDDLYATSPLTHEPIRVRITEAVMFDPRGERLHV